jgi:hypothetical protein
MPIAPLSGAGGELRLEVPELALGASPREPPVLERRDAGGIVAAVFEPLQGVDDRTRNGARPENADDSTHRKSLLSEIDPAGQALGQGSAPPQVKFGERM